jgi:hypothetical protein
MHTKIQRGSLDRKGHLEKSSIRWEGNIKIISKEKIYGVADWIYLAQDWIDESFL